MKNEALGCLWLVIILTLSPTLLGIPEDAQSAFASEQSFTVDGAIPPELVKVADLPGGDIMEIAFAPSNPNVVYLLSNTNAMGAFRSDDAGETWQQVLVDDKHGNTHTESMAVHPVDPDVVLVGDAHIGIIKTEDGGLQWKRVYPGPPIVLPLEASPIDVPIVLALAFSPSLPSVAYAGDTQGNILKSTDSGDTWQTVAQLEMQSGMTLAVDPGSPDTLYVGTYGEGGGVFKSTDGGQNWQQVLGGNVRDLSIAPGASDLVFAADWDGIFKSTDGGATWRLMLEILAHTVQMAPSDPRIVYAGTLEGVFKSVDGGETWQPHSIGMEYLNVGRLTVHPMDSNTVLAGSAVALWDSYGGDLPASTKGEGVYKTTDGGLSWANKNMGGFVDTDVNPLAVHPNNPNLVYVSSLCSRGVYASEDGGVSWAILRYPSNLAHYSMRLAVTADSVLLLTAQEGFAWSADGGQTWEQPFGDENRHFHGLGVSPHDPKLIFVGTAGFDPPETTVLPGAHILRSTDGGRSWEDVGSGFPSGVDTNVHDIIFDPFDPKVVYVATTSHEASIALGIYKSADGGETWSPLNTGLTDKNVHEIVASPATPGLLYAGTMTGIFRSTDGGDSWAYIGLAEQVRSLLIDPAEPRVLYAGTDEGLFWSPDGGDTWQRLGSVPAKPVMGLAMDANGTALYAAVNSVGVFRAYTTFTLTVIRSGTGSGTVTRSPAGIDCPGDCSPAYTSGAVVTLTATPASGSVFAGWSGGGCSGIGTCTVTLNADTAVTATFSPAFSLTVSKGGSGDGTVTSNPEGISCGSDCTEDYTSGGSVTLTANPNNGSSFKAWSGACTGTGTCTVTMSAVRSVTATYSKKFTDDPLTSKVTFVKAKHFAEAIEAINTLRSRNGLGTISFTAPIPAVGVTNSRNQMITLQTGLNAIYDALGRTRPTFDSIVPRVTVIGKRQMEQVRNAIRAVETVPTQ